MIDRKKLPLYNGNDCITGKKTEKRNVKRKETLWKKGEKQSGSLQSEACF